MIREARAEDLDSVLRIARERQLAEADARLERDGFLVSGYDLADYRDLLGRAEYFLVAQQGTRVVGFLLGYADQTIPSRDSLSLRMARDLGELIVIKQVAVCAGHARNGIGRRLYERVLAGSAGVPVIAAVVAEPENAASAAFHEAMGFVPWRRARAADGRERTVWLNRRGSREILLQQYDRAIELYQHEDLLNWGKVNSFFYISAALIAAYGLITDVEHAHPGGLARWLVPGICALGLITSVGFEVSLLAGVSYLHGRKAVVSHIEDMLIGAGGTRVVSAEHPVGHTGWLRSSPTRYLLLGVPGVLGLCWMGALLLFLCTR